VRSWKPWALVLFFGLALGLYQWASANFDLSQTGLTAVLTGLGGWAPWVYVGFRVLTTAVGVPAFILTIISGAVFGVFWGTVYSVLAAVLGSVGAFWIARYLARDWAQAKLAGNSRLNQLDQGLQANAFWYVLSSRLSPLLPFNVLNSLFGLTRVSVRDFALGTLLGIIPNTVAYAWLGQGGQQSLSGSLSWELAGALTALGLLSLLPILLLRRKQVENSP